jgi:hypothetical protein
MISGSVTPRENQWHELEQESSAAPEYDEAGVGQVSRLHLPPGESVTHLSRTFCYLYLGSLISRSGYSNFFAFLYPHKHVCRRGRAG